MNSENEGCRWDVIVVGGSAAGLSAALMLGRARRRVLVVDAGQPRNRFAAHMHGVLGQEGVPPDEFTRRGRAEAQTYGVQFRDAVVVRAGDIPSGIGVVLETGEALEARAMVVATGIADELPDIPGLAERWGSSVLHCPYCHGWEVADRHLGVLATSPASLHQAQMVRQWSERVTLFSAAIGTLDSAMEARLGSRGVQIVTSPVVEVRGTGPQVSSVLTEDGQEVVVEAIFTAGTPRPYDDFLTPFDLSRTQLPLGMGSFLVVDPAGRTSHPRIWAAGNVVNPMANVPMAIGAGAMAGGAANGALVEEDFEHAGGGPA